MVWFAILLLICSLLNGGINIVEARRRQSRNYNNNRIMHQPPTQRQHPAANRNRLRSTLNYNNNDRRNGYSPNLDAIYDEAHGGNREDTKDNFYSSKSFYKRHNMNTPPLISRAERYKQQQKQSTIKQQRRVLQTQDNGSNILTIPDSPISETTTNNTELNDIIETSKLGLPKIISTQVNHSTNVII